MEILIYQALEPQQLWYRGSVGSNKYVVSVIDVGLPR